MQYQEPPQNLEIEAALLGSLIQLPEAIDDIADRLRPEDFHSSMYGSVFEVLLGMHESSVAIDRLSIVEYLRRKGQLDSVGGPRAISTLLEAVPSSASIEYYVVVLRDLAAYRRIIVAGNDIMSSAYQASNGAEDAISDALRRIDEAARDMDYSEHLGRKDALAKAYSVVFEDNERLCIKSPYDGLNDRIGGCYPGELYVWAGIPKAGKTNFEIGYATHTAKTYGITAVFAIEMGQNGINERRFAMESGVTVKQQRSGCLSEDQSEAMALAFAELSTQPLEVYDRSIRSIPSIRRALHRLRREGPVRSIWIDHVGMLEEVTTESRHSTKADRLERVYNALIKLGSEFECPVNVIQHVNREGQKSARPTMSDIRDGGNPEGLAAGIFIINREDPMNQDGRAHLGEIIIANSRNGETDIIPMEYKGARGLWSERRPVEEAVYKF